uniref:Uncharacterized protein n=1 Tax=Anopheles stephensi TaxID=30069 RepID=A0A182XY35_ANOST
MTNLRFLPITTPPPKIFGFSRSSSAPFEPPKKKTWHHLTICVISNKYNEINHQPTKIPPYNLKHLPATPEYIKKKSNQPTNQPLLVKPTPIAHAVDYGDQSTYL